MKDKGKNFSCNNVNGQRRKNDFYSTPFSMTQQLLDREDFTGSISILEPACGEGAILKVLKEHPTTNFKRIEGYDLSQGKDFLKEDIQYDAIITNPPFSLAKEFILKAKEVSRNKFAMLLPLSYLHGEERYKEIYQDTNFPLSHIYVFTRYPMLGDKLRDDGKYRTGMVVFAFFIWDKVKPLSKEGPIIKWISNQKYILNKGDMK